VGFRGSFALKTRHKGAWASGLLVRSSSAILGPVSLTEIKQLPLSEKLQIMEAIWEDLRLHAEQVEVPQWHKDLLDERRKAVDEGREEVLDWDDVKNSLRGTVS
jgi:putative addiction module component (TIGR02574 family)